MYMQVVQESARMVICSPARLDAPGTDHHTCTFLYHLHVHIDAPEDGCELRPKHVERKKSVIKH